MSPAHEPRASVITKDPYSAVNPKILEMSNDFLSS
jgi:hypothetical protein